MTETTFILQIERCYEWLTQSEDGDRFLTAIIIIIMMIAMIFLLITQIDNFYKFIMDICQLVGGCVTDTNFAMNMKN